LLEDGHGPQRRHVLVGGKGATALAHEQHDTVALLDGVAEPLEKGGRTLAEMPLLPDLGTLAAKDSGHFAAIRAQRLTAEMKTR